MNDLPVASEYIYVLEETQKRWTKLLTRSGILYLYGMTGFGKTAQTLSFAQNQYKEWVRFSAAEDGFLDEAEQWLAGHKKLRAKALLLLDDLQWLFSDQARQKLFNLLLHSRQARGLHILLVSRAATPAYLSPLWVTQQMAVEDQEALRLGRDELKKLLAIHPTLAALPVETQHKLAESCQRVTNGYALGASAFFQRCAQQPQAPETAVSLATKDVWDFLDQHLLGQWTPSRANAAIRLSVYPSFTRAMAQQLLGEQTDSILQDFIEVGSFLTFQPPDTYTFAPFFWRYLAQKLRAWPEKARTPLYETAARCCEDQRNLEQALRCYKLAGRTDKMAELVVYLSENAEGCDFARIACQYMDELSPEWEQRDPRILGAKAMLCAYRMQTEECLAYLEQLRLLSEKEQKYVLRGDAMATYVRTLIACPYDTADQLKDNLLKFVDYFLHNGLHLQHIMPTGNLPSLINGGLDLLSWEKNKKVLYPIIKAAAEAIMGVEAVGTADGSMGEIFYEQNQRSRAMAYLTKALSTADLGGSIRVQYAVTGVMARLFQSEEQSDAAEEILRNMAKKAGKQHFSELLPNIEASLALCALLKNDAVAYGRWLTQSAPDEHAEFFITARFQLLVKARVYTALGRELEALYILGLLEGYAKLYRRTYLHIEVLTLKAIIFHQRNEDWQEPLFEAVTMAQPYGLVRIFADQGAALLSLWSQMDWASLKSTLPQSYTELIGSECKRMADSYPNYLKQPRRFGALSDKETAVLRLMAQGLNNTQIAQELGVNLGTAKFHVKNIMTKLQAENRTVAVKVAQEAGLL